MSHDDAIEVMMAGAGRIHRAQDIERSSRAMLRAYQQLVWDLLIQFVMKGAHNVDGAYPKV